MHRMARMSVAVALTMVASTTACTGSKRSTSTEASPSTTSSASSTSGTRAPHPPIEPGVFDETLTMPGDGDRSYRIVVPRSVAGGSAVPLLIALHGGVGSGTQFETTSGFDRLAEEHRFIVVYPDGTPIGGTSALRAGRTWNGGRCCGPAVGAQVDDVGFIAMVIDRVSARYPIDRHRVFAAGHSNGAIMSYRLACELSTQIVAIGVQAGSLEADDCEPSRPVSVFAIHGTADTNLPIDGGRGSGLSGIAFRSPKDAVATFAALDGCQASTTRNVPDNGDLAVESWDRCRAASAVEFVTVTGASHAWMGHPSPRAGASLAEPPYAAYDSSAAIWDFLAAHPR